MDHRTEELHAAIAAGDARAVNAALYADRSLVSARDRSLGSTPLHLAVYRGRAEIVDVLLESGAELDALETESRSTPLHWAAEAGNADIVRLLLARGASLEIRDAWFGLTPLGWAAAVFWQSRRRRDRGAAMELLRAAGARSDAFVELGVNDLDALRRVVLADRSELARRLEFAGDEMQPLHWAGAYGREDAVGLLLELGADPSARTSLGLTPLAAALQRAQSSSAARFLCAGITGDETTAVVGGFVSALDGAVLAPELASRLLFVASAEGHEAMVEALIQRGANPATRLRRILREIPMMATPLHVAVEHGREGTAKALLAAGAPPSAGAEDGTPTPLHVAAAEGLEALVRILLDGGADRTARERVHEGTPADWAEWTEHRELAKRLRASS